MQSKPDRWWSRLVFNIATCYMLYGRGKHTGCVDPDFPLKLLSACTSRWPPYMEVSCQKCCYADASFFILFQLGSGPVTKHACMLLPVLKVYTSCCTNIHVLVSVLVFWRALHLCVGNCSAWQGTLRNSLCDKNEVPMTLFWSTCQQFSCETNESLIASEICCSYIQLRVRCLNCASTVVFHFSILTSHTTAAFFSSFNCLVSEGLHCLEQHIIADKAARSAEKWLIARCYRAR